ncbi:MAG: maleylpyruvate isomerase family mycothiol-dependent enzyme [Actinomycetota bacterium]
MDTAAFLDALRRETDTMLRIAVDLPMDADVPTCPGWTVRDLLVHTGLVHRHKADTVLQGLTDQGAETQPEPTGDILEWFGDGIDFMLDAFEESDLSRPSWTWCGHDHDASWWVRRMAHETLIHGVDAAVAAGWEPVVDERLAEDGIDEILIEMLVGYPEWAEISEGDRTIELAAPSRSWHLRTCSWSGVSPNTDTAYTDEPGLTAAEAVEQPNVRIEGSAAALDLWLWGRGPVPDVDGDVSLAEYVRAVAAQGTQ